MTNVPSIKSLRMTVGTQRNFDFRRKREPRQKSEELVGSGSIKNPLSCIKSNVPIACSYHIKEIGPRAFSRKYLSQQNMDLDI
jgi:hypothetical protein